MIEAISVALPYIAGVLVLLVSLYGIFFVYQPSFVKLMRRRTESVLALASRVECLQGARLSAETLWMLAKLSSVGDSVLQAKLSRQEYSLLMGRLKELQSILKDSMWCDPSKINPMKNRLGGQCRGIRACYRKVIGQDVDTDIGAALEQVHSSARAIWRDGLAEYRMLSGVVDFEGRCLTLIGALRTERACAKYFEGSGARGQLLLIEGQLCRVNRVYETDLDEDHVTRELELYSYQHGTVHYLSIPSPFAPNKFYLSDGELSGIPWDNVPDRIVVLDTRVLVVQKGEEENNELFGEILQKTTCLQEVLVRSMDRHANAVKLVRWTGGSDRVSAFGFTDGRRSVVRERWLKPIPVSSDCTHQRAPIMVITND